MNQLNFLDAVWGERGGHRENVNRGERIGRRFSRPGDERYAALSKLCAAVCGRAERNRTLTAESAIGVEAIAPERGAVQSGRGGGAA
jgi:hypothetical protein